MYTSFFTVCYVLYDTDTLLLWWWKHPFAYGLSWILLKNRDTYAANFVTKPMGMHVNKHIIILIECSYNLPWRLPFDFMMVGSKDLAKFDRLWLWSHSLCAQRELFGCPQILRRVTCNGIFTRCSFLVLVRFFFSSLSNRAERAPNKLLDWCTDYFYSGRHLGPASRKSPLLFPKAA